MPDNPIERAAHAIGGFQIAKDVGWSEGYYVRGPSGSAHSPTFATQDEAVPALRILQARAVISAIREPSEDMVEAGASHELGLALVAAWERMIDAALEEGK